MTTRAHALQWICFAALAASTVACGSSTSATGPTGVSGSGAVITGRVTMTGAAALATGTSTPLALSVLPLAVGVPMASSASSTVTVTVVGTGATTTIDGSGSFTLDNVPAGSVQLHFQGRGADAMLTISGIEASDRISIAVTLNGSNARLDRRENSGRGNDNGKGNDVNGRIDAVDAGARSVRVGTTTIVVPTSALIRHGSRTLAFADLRVGDHIQVKGTRNGSTVTATEVKVEDDGDNEDDDRNDNDLRGAVSALSGTCPAVSFVVSGVTVTTSASTKFEDGACSGLRNDVRVEVQGTRTGNTLAASKVEFD
jgi:hypothetical protein